MKKANVKALLPIGVFLILYLGLGILFEYGLKISMGFYNIPIVVSFLTALLVACLQNKKISFDKKLALMGQGVGDKNIITMLIIFLMAGIFVGVVGRNSAESVAYFVLSIVPPQFAVCVIFIVSCFVSTAMGTSVGTIVALTPIASALAAQTGCDVAWMVAIVVGGALFGDNLSFISDTTIAATRTQGGSMRDKFRTNSLIVIPAAVVTLMLYGFSSEEIATSVATMPETSWYTMLPYLLVLVRIKCLLRNISQMLLLKTSRLLMRR